ncbi:glycosyltransferase family 2 protein [filamentous cyanobacterium LEGE 11480]|uniref:Glycosyltransferase family 2 protein n=1 Tax=Romeriopsis navalis LEGE 11480 TaxID=2777977 RepID=A0A928VNT6_9CYAN|nr:glycosyltransferase [Romeriopsis navalis]MBE9031017.1 glycosyltransferase family 2 protein [Romeriopsis navalis LEGE 11480]
MQPIISVIICTYNPRADYFKQVLNELACQSLPLAAWELLVIDNASKLAVESAWSLDWHPQGRIIREETAGLTAARLRGHQEAQGEILVFVDDDNLLNHEYLADVQRIFQQHPQLGAIGGRSKPRFETAPEPWMAEFYKVLALRDFGPEAQISERYATGETIEYPDFAPAGIGLGIRRDVFGAYVEHMQHDAARLALGRTGKKLTSGEDNDIVLTVMSQGWQIGYFPSLEVIHLISADRLERDYLARLNEAATRSWVQVLGMHNLQVWSPIAPWTVLPRKIKAFFTYGAWRNAAAYVRWRGACGLYEALAST